MTKTLSPTVPFQIKVVSTPEDQALFLEVPARVYANDPNWVPPLQSSVAKQFEADNPFLQYGKLQQFVAIAPEAGKSVAVGRIVAAVNQRLVEREGQQIGLFGFFECIENFEIAQALLQSAQDWLRDQGMAIARGPIDLSTHNGCLLLVDGFDSPPKIMMPYNPRYYRDFIEQDGWLKAKDAYAYDLPITGLSAKFEKAYRIASQSGVTFRPIHTKGEAFEQDCRTLYHLYSTTFSNNWSSTPRTEAEFMEEARSLKDLVDPEIFWLAEHNGEMIGFFMTLPDYNVALKHVNGKLNWLGILKFLWYRRQVHTARVFAIGSLPEYRRKLVPLALIYLGMKGGSTKRKPYVEAELSWVYEDNFPSRKIIEATGATITKTYRIYEKSL